MTANQSLKIYELLNAQFQQPERARELTEAIESVIEDKVAEGNKQYEMLLHKDLEILRVEIDAKLSGFKAELSKSIYLTGLVQFLAIVGSVIAIVTFAMKH